ncbi:hypothetical protein Pint_20474 [Pistacia integerrima]|uniref:Uncharacterized protein n=1 Tax=Pistacia integerrima TaxID=434235 RepID=A0ACC0XDU5_9ROSI|nr:hypothetical protein Pint_20474 [Pistacia integerrima]
MLEQEMRRMKRKRVLMCWVVIVTVGACWTAGADGGCQSECENVIGCLSSMECSLACVVACTLSFPGPCDLTRYFQDYRNRKDKICVEHQHGSTTWTVQSRMAQKGEYKILFGPITCCYFCPVYQSFKFSNKKSPRQGHAKGPRMAQQKGMAGLVCAFSLDKKGVKSTVFDTGIHGLGGRMGTRIIDPQPLIFDHAAQFFTVTDSWFGELERDILLLMGCTVLRLIIGSGKSNSFVLPVMSENFLIPVADIFAIIPPCTDRKMCELLAWFIRHTSQCLTSEAFEDPLPIGGETAAFGKQNKVPEENIPTATAEKVKTDMLEGVEAALGLQKCSLQKPFYTRVNYGKTLPLFDMPLISALNGNKEHGVSIIHYGDIEKGAALLTNTPGIPCIFDPHGRAGFCGDWFLGSSLECAALSMALADNIVDYLQSGRVCPEEFAVGLHNEFRPLEGYDIGQFPGDCWAAKLHGRLSFSATDACKFKVFFPGTKFKRKLSYAAALDGQCGASSTRSTYETI